MRDDKFNSIPSNDGQNAKETYKTKQELNESSVEIEDNKSIANSNKP